MKEKTRLFGLFLILLIVIAACSKESYEPTSSHSEGDSTTDPTVTISEEIQRADEFAQEALKMYYLWKKEIANAINSQLDPNTCSDPVATVAKIRYKVGGGFNSKQDEDRWTKLYDDITPFQESVQNVETTNGMSLTVGKFLDSSPQQYFFIVNLVYKGGPAEKKGLKRGDVIISYNGRNITDSNLEEAYYGEQTAEYGLGEWLNDGIHDLETSVILTSVKMYLDPIICNKTFEVDGKKVGYLMYDSFDLDSTDKLVNVCKQFKSEGVTELILDLRYNGGGYVFTENLLASMLVPEANVQAGNLYEQEIYNDVLTEAFSKRYGEDFNKTYFSYNHEYGEKGEADYKIISTNGANIGLTKIYAIVSSDTASASEALLVGLSPYIDIVIIGEQTHGKYCSGYILSVEDIYNNPPISISKWGIYVMVSTYADRNNKNIARPVGIIPNIEAKDTPWEGLSIGNENETMLKAALQAAGKVYPSVAVATTRSFEEKPTMEIKMMHKKFKFGNRIMQLPSKLKDTQDLR